MILALDPSFRNCGWSLWEGDRIIDCGVFKTEASKKDISRNNAKEAERISSWLANVIRDRSVTRVIAELPTGSQNQRAANLGGAIMGVVVAVCAACAVPITWVTPNDVKRMVAEKGIVSKDAVMAYVTEHVPFSGYPKKKGEFEHIADSVVVFLFSRKTA